MGFRALITESGTEAVALVQTEKPKICLAILDHDMPGLNGIETFTALSKLCSGLKAILYSGHPDMDYLRRKCPDGLVYHPKDYNRSKLKVLINQLLSQP
jgi:DNA-binding NtrC family response regulator